MFNNNEDITYGIESTIWESLEKSFDNDSIETFKVLNNFVSEVLFLSIKNKSIIHFSKYIIFPSSYYHNTYLKSKENLKFNKLHKYCTEIASMQLKEIISFSLKYDVNDIELKNFENIKINNAFLYHAFNGFNRLIYSIISKGDTSKFDYVINEYYLIDQLRYNSFNELKNEIRYNFRNKTSEELKLKEELYENIKFFEVYKRHVIIGLRYWSIFLYNVKKNNLEVTTKYLDELKIHADSQELLKDIIYLRNNPMYAYFEWSSWDYKERPNGKSYTPPSVRHWLTFGLLIDLIKQNNIYITSEFLNSKELTEINYFYETIVDFSKILLENFDYWQPILSVKNIEELEKRIEIVQVSFKNLKRESINATDKKIAQEKLSHEKIDDFKKIIGKTWNDFSLIRKLFIHNKNIEIANSDIKFIGQKTFFQNGKKMFIDDNYQQIYNIGEIGGQTSRWIDEDFFEVVLRKENFEVGNNIIDVIDKCLNYLKDKKIDATTIIVPSEYSYKSDGLINDKNFISKHDLEGLEENELTKYFIGKYKALNVYISHIDYIQNKVIVSDFINSFKMKYKTNPDWYDTELKIEVNSISNFEAESKYNQNPKKWIVRDNGIDLTKEEALVLIKNAVNLEIGSYNEFEIINPNAYIIGLIQNKIEG